MKIFNSSLFLLLFLKAFAQQDSLAAEDLIKKAGKYFAEGKNDSAGILHQQALELYQSNDMPYEAMRSYRIVFNALQARGKPVELLDILTHELGLERRPPQTNNEHAILCSYYLFLGYLFELELNDLVSARYYYERAYIIYQFDLHEKHDGVASFIYHKLGNIYTRLGDYGRSKALLKKKLEYGRKYNIPKMLEGYSDLALVYFEEESLDSAKTMILNEIDLSNSNVESKFGALNILASYWLRKGFPHQSDSVLAISKLQLDELEIKYSRKDFLKHKANWLGLMGETKEAVGLSVEALDFYMEVIAAYLEKSNGALKERELGKVYVKVSDLLLKTNNPTDALANVQKALQCVLPNFSPADSENPNADQLYAENTIIEALEQKANVLTAMGRIDEALSCFELIPLVEAKLRFYHQYEASSLILLNESRKRIEKAISMAQHEYQKTGEPKYAETAFRLSEQARGSLMIESILALDSQSSLPAEKKQQQRAFRSKMAWVERQLANLPKNKQQEAGELENQLFLIKQQNAEFQETLANGNQMTVLPLNARSFLSMGEVRKIIRPNQAMVSYFFTNDTLQIFFLSPNIQNGLSWRSEKIQRDFFPSLTELVENLGNPNQSPAATKKTLAILHRLYQLLLAPELEKSPDSLKSLLIIPDKTLSFLPFDVLLENPAAPVQGFDGTSLLINKYSLSYLTSATLALFHKHRNEKKQTDVGVNPQKQDELLPFAGFAPKYDGTTDALILVHRGGEVDSNLFKLNRLGLYDLPGAREEVRKIQGITGGDFYLGETAQKNAFLENAHKYRILHLAMHALPNRKNPSMGTLFFAQNNGSESTEEFTLYANELPSLELKADLAVLSACGTGEGVWKSGEGVYSLARFFLLAGVPSVVMSLWRLPDQSASEIMVGFYEAMKAGKEKDEALQVAKLAFLQAHKTDQVRLHPFFWSGMVLTGQ